MNQFTIDKRVGSISGLLVPAVITLICSFVSVPGVQNNSDLDDLLREAAEKVADKEESEARLLFEEALSIDGENLEALWNLSLLYSKEGYRKEGRDERLVDYKRARELAETCLDYYPEEASCHYVYAVSLGRISELSGARSRVRASREIKIHIDEALYFDPEHRGAWHLLGVWHSSAANLSRSERLAANVLFGGAPEGASNSEAEAALKRAIELDPESILFHLDLARFYRDIDRREKAAEVLEKTLQLQVSDQDDPENLKRARELLDRLQ